MENRLNRLNEKINDATNLKTTFSIISKCSCILSVLIIFLYSCLSEKYSKTVFLLVLIICIILIGLFIFSNIMESYCDKIIEQTKVKRTVLISRMESAKTKFEIANAFAHCYWNALDKTINNVDTENRLELSFITKK